MNQLLQHLVSEQAYQRPDSTALMFRDSRISYAELEQSTNQLARLLHAAGCKRNDRVCFAIPKSTAAIIAILGILKADCLHVPLDTNSPLARIRKIVASTQPRCILGVASACNLLDQLLADRTAAQSIGIGWMDTSRPATENFDPLFLLGDLDNQSVEPLCYRNSEKDGAHILFTSGSTGEPKGVVITHSNVFHFVQWATKYFAINSTDRISCHPPLHFDLAYFDIFGALSTGAELHLVPAELSLLPHKLAEFIRSSELTQWFSVPSALKYMSRFDVIAFHDFPALKRLLWCGETFPTPDLIYWMKRLPQVVFTNLYGPTETTIASSYYTLPNCPSDDQIAVPIGTPCEGEQLMVLDNKLQPTTAGETGELYIAGVGLSPGYWQDPEGTARSFVYMSDGKRMYKTGDLARRGEDGLIYFLGRADTQIKSRGYRIELGEIEAALNSLESVRESAVVAIPSDVFEESLICCAYVPADNRQSNATLRSELARLLPTYMLPARWLVLKQLPTNSSGKIDRRKLVVMFRGQFEGKSEQPQMDLTKVR